MKNLYRILCAALIGALPFASLAQVGVGTTAPDASAALDIVSSSKGVLLPRVVSATAIANPATGLIVFQTGAPAGFYYNAGPPAAPSWQQIATAAGAAITAGNGLTKTGQHVALGGTLTGPTTIAQGGNTFSLTGGNVGIGTTAPTQTLDVNGSLRVRGLNGTGNRLPVVQSDGTLGLNAPVFSTDPVAGAPTTAAGSAATGTNPFSVAVSGTRAYVVNSGSNTLQVFDVSVPTAPVLLNPTTPGGTTGGTATGTNPFGVAVSGTTAYVVNQTSNTLQVFDCSNPAAPVLQNTTSTATGNKPYCVAVSGTTAYVVNLLGNSLQVFDVSTPSAPVLKSTTSTGTGQPVAVAVSGTTAYVVNYAGNTLQVYDCSVLTAPVLKNTTATPTGTNPRSVAVSGTTVYVVNQSSNTLQAFDVSVPTTPVLLNPTTPGGTTGGTATGTQPQGVAVSGTMVYVANFGSNTLQVFNMSNPAAPVLRNPTTSGGTTGGTATGNNPLGVAVSGTTAYVASYGSGTLQVFTGVPSRLTVVNPDGSFSSVATPALSVSGQSLSITGGNTVTLPTNTGPQGSAGTNGTNGTNGLNALVKTTSEAASPNCTTGGTKVETGSDTNANGILDAGEVTATRYLCNGATGAAGTNGINGTNGTTGAAGAAGTNGLNALVKTTVEAAGANCTTGGTKVETGSDTNVNGILDAGEVTATRYVCNGTDASVTASNGLTKTGANVALGGALTSATAISTTAANPLTVDGAGVVSLGIGTGTTKLGNATGNTSVAGGTIGLTGPTTINTTGSANTTIGNIGTLSLNGTMYINGTGSTSSTNIGNSSGGVFVTGSPVNINNGTGTTTIGTANGTGAIAIDNGTTAVKLGRTGDPITLVGSTTINGTGSGTTSIGASTGATTIGGGPNSGATNIGTGTSAGAVTIGRSSGTVKLANLGAGLVTSAADGTLSVTAAPSGANFIQNQATPQASANFNVSGAGTVGGLLTAGSATVSGQAGVGTTAPAPSAKLEVSSTTQGFLPPRLTAAQRDAIASPVAGLLVFQTDGTPGIYYYAGTYWVNLTNGRVPDATGSTVPANGAVVTTLAGTAGLNGSTNGTGAAARFDLPGGVAVDASGTVYVADTNNNTIRSITAAGVVSTLAGTAGSAGSADGTGAVVRFSSPAGVAVDASGTVYVADANNNTIRKISAGVVSTLAGTAGVGTGSADGTGAAARFNAPAGVAVDAAGTVYVADQFNHTIRKISAAGVVTTLAGTAGSSGSADGPGAAARFNRPTGVAVDATGTVYVADQSNHTIRKISAAGVVTTLAGTAGSAGSADGTSTVARFKYPTGVAVDAAGAVYVADGGNLFLSGNHTIRKITAAGVVTTLAGTAGIQGSTNGTGAAARFYIPMSVAVDTAGTLYVADTGNYTIRVIK